jgi:hypothetical protein
MAASSKNSNPAFSIASKTIIIVEIITIANFSINF